MGVSFSRIHLEGKYRLGILHVAADLLHTFYTLHLGGDLFSNCIDSCDIIADNIDIFTGGA